MPDLLAKAIVMAGWLSILAFIAVVFMDSE